MDDEIVKVYSGKFYKWSNYSNKDLISFIYVKDILRDSEQDVITTSAFMPVDLRSNTIVSIISMSELRIEKNSTLTESSMEEVLDNLNEILKDCFLKIISKI